MKATILLLMTGGVLCAQPPQSHQGSPPMPPAVKALDADNNGELSATEIAGASTALATLDADGNGRLSEEEISPKPPEGEDEGGGQRPPRHGGRDHPADPVMDTLDQNSDGSLSKGELARASKSLLELDEDDSGTLEKEEMTPEDSPEGEGEEGASGGRPPHPPRR